MDRLPVAEAYCALLADAGTVRGLIGPREVPRLWDRHLLNCAVLTDLVPVGASVCDVGSGAGLPGLVMAIRRPDLQVTLVEPLLRRTTFLDEAVRELGLANVEVIRARAEALHGVREFDVVTSRAVAGLEKLASWSVPLTRVGGEVVAMKGERAEAEVEEARDALRAWGAGEVEVVRLGEDVLAEATTVVRIPVLARARPARMTSGPVPGTSATPRNRAPKAARRTTTRSTARNAGRVGRKPGGSSGQPRSS